MVLSEESGDRADIDAFYTLVKQQYPDEILELQEDDGEYETVTRKLQDMNKENRVSRKQVHKALVIKPFELPLCMEDSAREETEYFVVMLKPLDEEKEQETLDLVSCFYNCQGLIVRKQDETMEEFVKRLF